MGEVYLAEDSRLRRRVALKVLPSQLAVDDASEKRLLREARAAATLDHPNICTVYEVGEADGCGFIAMQFVDGENLADRLKKAPLDLLTAISIGRQIADAVAEAHRQGIVHRDIKPQNVMLSSANRVTVLDFGLAKTTASAGAVAETASMLTNTGVVSGTLSYLSPEQARAETVDERSDVFSFGNAHANRRHIARERIHLPRRAGQTRWPPFSPAIRVRSRSPSRRSCGASSGDASRRTANAATRR